MKQNFKADLYTFDIHYHSEPVEHFQNVMNFRFREVIASKDFSGNPIEIFSSIEEIKQKMLTYLNCCDEFTNSEDDCGTQSAWKNDQQNYVDFLSKCEVTEKSKFLFFTLEGTDLNILFVHDFEESYNRISSIKHQFEVL